MCAVANYLICEDTPSKSQAIFILSGAPTERSLKASELYKNNLCKNLICTGETHPQDFAALGIDVTEAELTKMSLVHLNIPDSLVALLKEGTSTQEEANAILKYCIVKNLTAIAIISSKFHTRRIRNVFKEKFSEKGIEVKILGASAIGYNELEWWNNEYGLIALNNEYVKLLYYCIK